jgi:hypothetical protein
MPANLQISPGHGKQGPDALTTKNHENFDQIYANNLVWRSGIHINSKKLKIFFPERGASELKNLRDPHLCLDPTNIHASQQKTNPSRDPVPLKEENRLVSVVVPHVTF